MRAVWLVLTAGFRRQWRSWVLLGAVGGIVVAALLSLLAPLGEARLAEPAPGLSFDAAVLGLGALATVVVVMTLGVLPALRAARTRGAAERTPAARPSLIAGGAVTAGAPPGAVIGVRHALERGRGTRAVPVGTALIGAVAGVAALCATAVFGSSLAHLTVTPALYGAPFQDYFNTSGPGSVRQNPLINELEGDRTCSDPPTGRPHRRDAADQRPRATSSRQLGGRIDRRQPWSIRWRWTSRPVSWSLLWSRGWNGEAMA